MDSIALRRFVDMLTERNIGPPGLLGKLNSIEQGLRYFGSIERMIQLGCGCKQS